MNNIDPLISELIKLAKFAGSRFDLVQAGGGNVSLKTDKRELIIKASGLALSEVSSIEQCAILSLIDVKNILNNSTITTEKNKSTREQLAQHALTAVNHTAQRRPSIESFLHALLYRFTLHTHPITVNHLVIEKNAKQIITKLFPDSLFINYDTPGIDLAILLKQGVDNYVKFYRASPKIIFLKNHGVIVSADTAQEVKELTDFVVITIEKHLGLNYERYRYAEKIANLMQNLHHDLIIAWLSEDQIIYQILEEHPHLLTVLPTCPDTFVFNGFVPCHLTQWSIDEFKQYAEQYQMLPKVILFEKKLYFLNSSVRKAKEMEDVYKFHLMVLANASQNIDTLPMSELAYLGNWEAEKYRQQK